MTDEQNKRHSGTKRRSEKLKRYKKRRIEKIVHYSFTGGVLL
jgi:hypothetical protein